MQIRPINPQTWLGAFNVNQAIEVEAGQRVLAWHEDRLAKSEPKLREHLHKLLETEPFWRR